MELRKNRELFCHLYQFPNSRYLDGLGLIIIIGLDGGTIYPILTIRTNLKIAGAKIFIPFLLLERTYP